MIVSQAYPTVHMPAIPQAAFSEEAKLWALCSCECLLYFVLALCKYNRQLVEPNKFISSQASCINHK